MKDKFNKLFEEVRRSSIINKDNIGFDELNRKTYEIKEKEIILFQYKEDYIHEISYNWDLVEAIKEADVRYTKKKKDIIYSISVSNQNKSSKSVFAIIKNNKVYKYGCSHIDKFTNHNTFQLSQEDLQELNNRTILIKDIYN